MGYIPEALVNYLVRLGWSYGDQEVFSINELIQHFSFDNVGKSAAVFNPEKFLWLNSQYIIRAEPESLTGLVKPFLIREKIIEEGQTLNEQWLSKAISTLQERSKTLLELAQSLGYYIGDDVEYAVKAKEKFLNEKYIANLTGVKEALTALDNFTSTGIEKVFVEIAEKLNTKLGNIAQPVRVAITGRTESPGIFEVLEIIGKEKSLKRIDRAIKEINEGKKG
jgi:glutamyl-tRNA synthetase